MIKFNLNKKWSTRIVGIAKDTILIENLLGKFQVRYVDTSGLEDLILALDEGVEIPLQSSSDIDQRFLVLCRELEKRKFIVHSDRSQPPSETPFIYEKLGIERDELDRALRKQKVLVVSNFKAATALLEKLRKRGVQASLMHSVNSAEDLQGFSLVISFLKDPQSLVSEMLYKFFYQESSSYLSLEAQYAGYVLGPLLKKNSAPCLCCLNRRREASGELRVLQIDEHLIDDIVFENLFNSATLEVIRILTKKENVHLLSGLFVSDILNNITNYHEIWPIPNCMVCNTTLSNPRSFYEY